MLSCHGIIPFTIAYNYTKHKKGLFQHFKKESDAKMSRKVVPSVYNEQIITQNFYDTIDHILIFEDMTEPGFNFKFKPNIREILQNDIKKINFNNFDYLTYCGNVYWFGVLYAYPFDDLVQSKKINPDRNGWDSFEADLLNLIKDNNIIVDEELNIKFTNPTSSPLYRFFNKYKKDAGGGNISASIGELIRKIAQCLEANFNDNMDAYGNWILEDEVG